jgi:probable rRNA maturation factor
MIDFTEADKPYGLYSDNFSMLEKWIEDTILSEGKELGEITIINCSDEYLLNVNKEHLNHDYYTDVITFDYVVENIVSGDIYISEDRIVDNANQLSIDSSREFLRVVIHGVLHLCGYKDGTKVEKELMTDKENYYLKQI